LTPPSCECIYETTAGCSRFVDLRSSFPSISSTCARRDGDSGSDPWPATRGHGERAGADGEVALYGVVWSEVDEGETAMANAAISFTERVSTGGMDGTRDRIRSSKTLIR
jgi:hypothetical protein